MYELILIRHGRSEWNEKNLFTGWYDCELMSVGLDEARQAGVTMREAGIEPRVVHTSLQKRAIQTAQLTLEEMNRLWLPTKRSWRLNERHYGDLTGKDKKETTAEYGEDQVHIWRRSYDTPPPPIKDTNKFNPNNDAQYANLPPEVIPAGECLKDVVDRMLPYFYDNITADLQSYGSVMVVAHGNSLRALVKHLDNISDDEITELNIPTGIPLQYKLGDNFRPLEQLDTTERYLGDAQAAKDAAAAVANQAK